FPSLLRRRMQADSVDHRRAVSFDRFGQLGEHAVGAAGVKESDASVVSPGAGTLVKQAQALGPKLGDALAQVGNGEGHVVYALTALVDELGHGAVRFSRLEKLQPHVADAKER